MAVDVNLETISSGYNISKINTNFQAIDVALQDAISRSGTTPNEMDVDLDMNGNDILNVDNIDVNVLTINGVPVSVDVPVGIDTDALVPSGGTDGQVLTKQSGADFDMDWEDVPEGIPSGGLDGQVLTKQSNSDFDADWQTPVGGTGLPYVEDYGAEGDGVTDDAAAFAAGIAAVVADGGNRLYCRNAEYAIGSTIVIGNGSAAAYSTINGVSLIGVGAPFQRLDNGGGPQEDNGTRLKWIGAAGGTMVRIAGPCQGNDIRNIALNMNGLAAKGLEILSGNRGTFPNITVSDPQANGTCVGLNVVHAESIGGQTEAIASEGNHFEGLRITATASGSIGVDLDGYTGSAANGWDSVRNTFHNTYMLVNRVGGTGIRVAFADQNTFEDIFMTAFGVSDGNEASVRLVGTLTVPSNGTFPQNIRLIGNVDIGQELPYVTSDNVSSGNTMEGMTLFDQQDIPRWPHNKYLHMSAVETDRFPNGGFWQMFGGLSTLTPENRNVLANSRFERATLGTSIVNPASGATLLDDWFITYDGSVTCTVSRQEFTPGQDDVPFEPHYFMRIVVSAASGSSFLLIGQGVSDVHTFEGRRTTLSAWLKASTSINVSANGQQLFGSGGSAGVDNTSPAQAVGTSWTRNAYEIQMASISGKTVGSGSGNIAYLTLPVNTTFTLDIALPQWELGRIDTPPERRPNTLDALIKHSPANLVALADIASATTGILSKTGTGAFAARTLTAPAAGITVTNGDGVSGNPTLALADDLAALEALTGTDTIYRRSGTSTWSPVTIGSSLSFSGGTLGLNVANANTWTANQTFSTSVDSATVATFSSTNAGANAGPYSDWVRDSASPAANDGLGIFRFIGRNASATLTAYTSLVTNIKTVTAGAEDAQFRILNMVAGAQTVVFDVQGGVQLGSPTGSDKGVGTLNVASRVYVNNNEVPYRLQGTATYDPASLADAAGVTTTVTVTGAALGDIAAASFSNALQGITLTAWVSATDTVSVRFQNESGGTLDLASGTLKAWVFK